jgi:hypothetical protein
MARWDNPDDGMEAMNREREVLARYGLERRPLLKRHCPITEEEERYIQEPFYRRAQGFVYFIQAGESGPIKIGFSSDPKMRFGALQTAHHETLRLVATMPGTESDEAKMHKRFKKSRIRGEWFRPSHYLMRLIRDLKDGRL